MSSGFSVPWPRKLLYTFFEAEMATHALKSVVGSLFLLAGGATQALVHWGAIETLPPVSEQVYFGTKTSGGNLQSWFSDDGNVRRICRNFQPDANGPFMRVDLGFIGTITSPSGIDFKVKIALHTPGPLAMTLKMYDHVQAKYVNTTFVHTNIVNGVTYTGSAIAPLDRYVGLGGSLIGQIEVRRNGAVPENYPCVDFGFASMTLVP